MDVKITKFSNAECKLQCCKPGTFGIHTGADKNKISNFKMKQQSQPKEAQRLINILKAINIDLETTKTALQNWYNEDKGKSLYTEISDRFNENKIIQCNQSNEGLSSEAA